MSKTKKISKIKENISEQQYKLLLSSLRGSQSIRKTRKDRLLKLFVILYNLGIRVNETSQFTNNMMNELLSKSKLIIKSHKQCSEKVVYVTETAKKEIKKIFGDIPNDNKKVFVSERGSKSTPLEPTAMIRDVNNYLRSVFGSDTRLTSHSFRQTLISNLAINGVNTKVIQNLVGHRSINTTYRYIKSSEADIMAALETAR